MTELPVQELPADIAAEAALADRDVPGYVDYFAPGQPEWVTLPDGVQQVQIAVLSEGERRKYLNKTNSEVRMNTRTKDMIFNTALADEVHALIETAVVDWRVKRNGSEVPFSKSALRDALDVWPPALIDFIAEKIRDANSWLRGTEDDLEALYEERKKLNERIDELETRKAKN